MKIFQIPSDGKVIVAVETGKVMYLITSCVDAPTAADVFIRVKKGLVFESFVEQIKTFPVLNRQMAPDGSVRYTTA